MPAAEIAQPTSYQLQPELRRCAIYVIVGVFAIISVACCVGQFMQRDLADLAIILSAFLLVAVAMVVPLRWKLRVDSNGILRRLVFRWDRWSWSDFASGRIEKRHPITLFDPQRPWWRNRLRIHWLSSSDAKCVIGLINTHYQLPPAPEIGDELEIKYGFRRSARFDQRGIHLASGNAAHDFGWHELDRLHITRLDPVRRDFVLLELVLPDQTVELRLVTHQGGTTPTWRGATAEEINEFLLAHCPGDRLDVDVGGERPRTRASVEKQRLDAQTNHRHLRIVQYVFYPLAAAILIWMAIDEGVVKACFMAAMSTPIPLVYAKVLKDLRTQIEKLEMLLAEFDDRELSDSE